MNIFYILVSIWYFFIFNNVYLTFWDIHFYDATEVFHFNNVIITSMFYISIIISIDIIIMFFWKKYFNKYSSNYSSNYVHLFIYNFIIRFIPILSHIWSFLSWMNKNKFIYNILFLISWYLFYLIIWYYILSKFY